MARKRRVSAEDSELFRRSVGNISRIEDDRVIPRKNSNKKFPSQQLEQNNYLPGQNEVPLVGVSDQLSYRQPGIQQRLLDKLKKGKILIERQLDLHGMTRLNAEKSLLRFIKQCSQNGIYAIRIIHGKGHGSDNKLPVIKNMLNQVLRNNPQVLAFCSARQNDGGTGALYVLLKN